MRGRRAALVAWWALVFGLGVTWGMRCSPAAAGGAGGLPADRGRPAVESAREEIGHESNKTSDGTTNGGDVDGKQNENQYDPRPRFGRTGWQSEGPVIRSSAGLYVARPGDLRVDGRGFARGASVCRPLFGSRCVPRRFRVLRSPELTVTPVATPAPAPTETSTCESLTDTREQVRCVWSEEGLVDVWPAADCIAQHESGYNRWAVSPSGGHFGIYQESVHFWGWLWAKFGGAWSDAVVNTRAAVYIWRIYGWQPWSTRYACGQ